MSRSKIELIELLQSVVESTQLVALTMAEFATVIKEKSTLERVSFPDNLFEAIGTSRYSAIILPNDGTDTVYTPGVFKARDPNLLRIDFFSYSSEFDFFGTYKGTSVIVDKLAGEFKNGMVILQFFEDKDNDMTFDIQDISDVSHGLRPITFVAYGNEYMVSFPYIGIDKELPDYSVAVTITLSDGAGKKVEKTFHSFINAMPPDGESFLKSIRHAVPEIEAVGAKIKVTEVTVRKIIKESETHLLINV